MEALTDRLEAEAEAIFARIREMSPDGSMTDGILQGIENGWFTGEIAEASFAYQQKLEKGEKKIVGVNAHTGTVAQPLEILRISPEVEREQVKLLAARRAERDQRAVDAALAALVAAARTDAEPGPAHAGRRPRRSHPRRDLRRPPHRMGLLHRTRLLLTVPFPSAARRSRFPMTRATPHATPVHPRPLTPALPAHTPSPAFIVRSTPATSFHTSHWDLAGRSFRIFIRTSQNISGLIRASGLIWGPIVHQINPEALFHQDLFQAGLTTRRSRITPPSRHPKPAQRQAGTTPELVRPELVRPNRARPPGARHPGRGEQWPVVARRTPSGRA